MSDSATLYSIEFQKEILHLLATNIKFAINYGVLLKLDYFDTKPDRILFELIKNHIFSYECELDFSNLLLKIEEYIEQHGLSNDLFRLLKSEANAIYNTHVKSEQFVTDELIKFARRQELKNAILKSINILEKDGEYEEVLSLIDNAVSIGFGVEEGLSYNDIIKVPLEYRKKYNPINMVRSGFSSFDHALMGGMAEGELHIIQAPPKCGKSTLACNFGVYSLVSGKAVYHVTLEIKKLDVLTKYALRLTGLSYDDLMTVDIKEYEKKIRKFDKYKPNLFVNYWTEATINILTIRSWITRKKLQTGKNPGLIIVDYDDCLLPVTSAGEDNLYATSGNIYSDLIGLADYFKCPVLSFSQPVREAWNKANNGELILRTDLAHSAKKAHKAFSISSMNIADNADRGILFLDITRRGKSCIKIPIQRDLNKALIKEVTPEDN